jgi:NADH:ubiquinone oxidoreductase subunit D
MGCQRKQTQGFKQMATFSAEAGAYLNACNLIKTLRQAGIEAYITAGGVSIECQPNEVNLVQEICKKFKASFKAGLTSHQENVILKSKGIDGLVATTENARSIVKEWEE